MWQTVIETEASLKTLIQMTLRKDVLSSTSKSSQGSHTHSSHLSGPASLPSAFLVMNFLGQLR